jgi:AAHS family 3-hydroxyphenylpropionic acid transporter
LVGGRLADRFGRKRALIIAVAVFGLFSLTTAWASSFQMLVLTRLLTGVGLGGALPNLIALAAENAPDGRRNLAVSIMYCGMPFGGGLASLLIGVGGDAWRSVFYIGGLTPIIVIPVLIFALPDSYQFTEQKAATSKVGVFEALFGEARLPLTLALWAAFFSGLLILYLLLNWLPSMLVSRGLTRSQASLVQAVFNLVGVFGAASVGALMDGPARRWAVGAIFICMGTSLWLLGTLPITFEVALICGGLVGAATLGSQSVFYNLAPSFYPTVVRGTGLGVAVAAGRLGSVAGPLLAASLVGSGHSAGDVLLALLPLVAISGTLAIILGWRKTTLSN